MKLSRQNLIRLLQLQEDRKQFVFCIDSEIDKIASVSGWSSEPIAIFYGLGYIDMVKTVLTERLDMLYLDPKTDIYGQPELF